MPVSEQPRRLRVTIACGAATSAIATIVLLGWTIDGFPQLRLGHDHTVTRVNTALCLLLVGLALVMATVGRRPWAGLVAAAGAAVAGVGLVTLGQYAFGVDLGLDTLVSRGVESEIGRDAYFPSRMAQATAVALVCVGTGLVLGRRRPVAAQALALVSTGIGYLALLGYAYGEQRLHMVGRHSDVSADTALALLLAGGGLLWLHPDHGVPRLVHQSGAVGRLVRPLFAFAVLVPPLVGALRLAGQTAGLYGTTFGVTLMTLGWTVGGLAVTWVAASKALPLERAAEAALTEARRSAVRLAMEAEASALFGSSLELDEVLRRVSVNMTETIGDACEIRLLDPSSQWLVPAAMHHSDPERHALMVASNSSRNHVGTGLTGRVLRTREPLLVPRLEPAAFDKLQDPVSRETVRDRGVLSLIIVPLLAHGRALGTLAVARDVTETPYDEEDVALVLAIAERGAQAIDHAKTVATRWLAERVLTELGRRALSSTSAESLVTASLELVRTKLSPRHVALLLDGPGDGVLRVAGLLGPKDETPLLPVGAEVTSPLLLEVFAGGGSLLVGDLRGDPDPRRVQLGELLSADSGAAVAISGRRGLRGVLAVASIGVDRHTDHQVQFLEASAGIIASALDRLDSEASLRDVADQRRALLSRISSAQEEERSRIADGVHDDQVQVMAALGLRLGMLRGSISKAAPQLLPELDRLQTDAQVATDRLRDLMFDLQPPSPDLDLPTSLEEAAIYLFEQSATTWRLRTDGTVELPREMLLVAYRIMKEALVNVLKHADARSVTITVSQDESGTRVEVADDGTGMPPELTRSRAGHRGLSSMHDRASVAGGSLRVDRVAAGGTSVTLWLPRREMRVPAPGAG